MDLLLRMLQHNPEEGKSLLEVLQQEFRRNSISKDRLGRVAAMIFFGQGSEEEKKNDIIKLYLDYGYTPEEAQERYNRLVEWWSTVIIRSGRMRIDGKDMET